MAHFPSFEKENGGKLFPQFSRETNKVNQNYGPFSRKIFPPHSVLGQNPLDRIYPPSIIQLLILGHLPEKKFFTQRPRKNL